MWKDRKKTERKVYAPSFHPKSAERGIVIEPVTQNCSRLLLDGPKGQGVLSRATSTGK